MNMFKRLTQRFFTLVFFLTACAASQGQSTSLSLDEDTVKGAIVEGSVVFVCVNDTLLEFIGADTAECKRRTMIYADTCWNVLDKLIDDYSLIGDEFGKRRFETIGNLYTYCLESHVLMSEVRSQK